MRSRATEALGEAAGWFAGWTIAPAKGLFTRLRGAWLLHAEGAAYHAVVAPAARLEGEARRHARRLVARRLRRASARAIGRRGSHGRAVATAVERPSRSCLATGTTGYGWGWPSGWLGDRDSNPDSMVQSHVSYRWTISQQTANRS